MILGQLDSLDALLGREQRDRLLTLAVVHGEAARTALAEAFAARDRARAGREAHRLRGAVAPFGADALVALLQRVEAGADVPADEVDAAVGEFVAACREARG